MRDTNTSRSAVTGAAAEGADAEGAAAPDAVAAPADAAAAPADAAAAERAAQTISLWRSYLPEDCVATMIEMRWHETTSG